MDKNCLDEMKKHEQEEREIAYKNLELEYGTEAVLALKNHFAIYDERFYLWLADLYDPGEYDGANALGGGFFYSNSARDNFGFYIDVESTMQALGFLEKSGMLKAYSRGLAEAIPKRMQREMTAFALSLQSEEDGYFYHSQWGADIAPARRGRDLGWSTLLLSKFGTVPYWNTPNGHVGSLGAPKANRKDKNGENEAKSKWPSYLESPDAWREYLTEYVSDISNRSYPIGHVIAEQAGEIKGREAEARANGEPTGYLKITEEVFNGLQRRDNGLWQPEISYASVNGLMKIMAIYNSFGIKFKYAEQAFDSAVKIILLDGADALGKEVKGSVDVYNPWIAITRIFDNVSSHGPSDEVVKMRTKLRDNAASMIRMTTKKTLNFRKPDGSYGYTLDYSPKKSQGVNVAMPETIEGDVNGGTIALCGVTNNMLAALGIEGLTIYSPSDFEIFIKRAFKRKHLKK